MLVPLSNKVIIKVCKIEEKVGSIYMPSEIADREQLAKTTGKVVSMGPLVFADEVQNPIKIGDTVYFLRYGGMQHIEEENGEKVDYRIVNDIDIVAISRG